MKLNPELGDFFRGASWTTFESHSWDLQDKIWTHMTLKVASFQRSLDSRAETIGDMEKLMACVRP